VLSGDVRLASTLVDALTGLGDTVGVGKLSLEKSVTNFVGRLSLEAARFEESSADAEARHSDITLRRETISGVNIDEELAQMIIYQNSYGASARLMTAAQSMFDQLLQMIR
jgi:flagellar hook-associated protein 1 FlgK